MFLSSSLANLVQVIVGALATGSLYALLLVGVLLIYQVSRSFNFAYGQVGVFGAFTAYLLHAQMQLPPWVAVLGGVGTATLLSALTDISLMRRIPDRQGFDLVVTLGAFLLLTAAILVVFGLNDRNFFALMTDVGTSRSGVFINGNDVISITLGVVVIAAVHLILNRTSLGVSLRASAENPTVALSVGINVVSLRTLIWAAAGVLGAAGAMMFASRIILDVAYVTPIVINVFIAGMIGGLERYWPPLLAAYGVAIYSSLTNYIFGSDAATPALVIAVLLIFGLVPSRFLEERYEARA